ncbi:MAG TPA: CapA family protein [Paludibaculum sp.]|jgi:poly-gamma-glutamate synthesis protein (capsule biosynthesis protein)
MRPWPLRFLVGVALLAAAQAQTPVRVMFTGDIMLDNGPGHLITNGKDPFAAIAGTLRDADLVIGNLECAITSEGHAEDKPYTFKGPRSAIPLLKSYFSAVSLANNHSRDWGVAGFADELRLLDQAGLKYFGGGRDDRQARQPLILTAQGKRIAFLGYNDYPPERFAATRHRPGVAWLKEKDVAADIRTARERDHADFVLLFLHWGYELEETPLPEQVSLAQRLIDAGADAVIGAHPHVTQTVQWYKDRPIVYSLGNLVFDYFPTDPPVWKGWMARLSLGGAAGTKLELFAVEMDPSGAPHLVPGVVDPRR